MYIPHICPYAVICISELELKCTATYNLIGMGPMGTCKRERCITLSRYNNNSELFICMCIMSSIILLCILTTYVIIYYSANSLLF